MSIKAVVLEGLGINCDYETSFCLKKSGFSVSKVHLNLLSKGHLNDASLLVFPGGFSFSDHLGAGKALANRILFSSFREDLELFVSKGGLVLGICNGFQVLSKLGILPYPDFVQRVSLAPNQCGSFEDRWVRLKTNPNSPCVFTSDIDFIDLPVRHGEGRFVAMDDSILNRIISENLYVFQYVDGSGRLAGYPYNPNGSVENIAGICDPSGRIFGLMPHPEGFNHKTNHPFWKILGINEGLGLKIFYNAFNFCKK